jgi:hypothetical protein
MGKSAGPGGWWIVLIFIIYWVVIAIRGGTGLFKYLVKKSDLSLFLMTLLILLYFIPVFILASPIPSSVGGGYRAGSFGSRFLYLRFVPSGKIRWRCVGR